MCIRDRSVSWTTPVDCALHPRAAVPAELAAEVTSMAEDMSKTGASGEKTLIRDISFCGVPENGSNASMVDVKDGKIIRIRPMHYDWKYKKEDLNPWKMEVRGSTFEPSMKTLIPPYSLAYKKRVYSPARIRYPMMRVDFDPDGERNPQNRGVSKFKRISWEKALDVITSEMNRIKEKYGPTALLYQCDQHGENKVVQACHGAGRKLLREWGGFTLQMRQPDSWEGWWWGSKHFWGCEPVGQAPQSNLLWDIAKHAELLLFWGCDQETTPWGWPCQPHGVVSWSQPQKRRSSAFLAMSQSRLLCGACPTGSQPQKCLLPHHQPSQLSGWRICSVYPPHWRSSLRPAPWQACTTLFSPCWSH